LADLVRKVFPLSIRPFFRCNRENKKERRKLKKELEFSKYAYGYLLFPPYLKKMTYFLLEKAEKDSGSEKKRKP
jgi:hypothetical protein